MHNQLDESTRIWGMSCHLCALARFAIPFGSILLPLIIWLSQKNRHPFINEQGKESVNFQISLLIYESFLTVIVFIVSFFLPILFISIPLRSYPLDYFSMFFRLAISYQIAWITLTIFDLIMIIIAAVKAYNGQSYRYPFNWRFLR